MLSYLHKYPAISGAIDHNRLRHWSSNSEQYTGCDALFAMLLQGWQITGVVFCQQFWFSDNRSTHVYYFRLMRGDELTRMSVLHSPHVERFIMEKDLLVFQVNRAPFSDTPMVAALRHAASDHETEKETVEVKQVICA